MVSLRVVTLDDVPGLTDLLSDSRSYLQPFEPRRNDSYFQRDYQAQIIRAKLLAYESGRSVPFLIVDGEKILGQLALSGIEMGALKSAFIGYWVARDYTDREVATSAVRRAREYAFGELGLHRLQAATTVENIPSQRVLAKVGFERIGYAPHYMEINGMWRDHLLFQLINQEITPG
ncbi:MAG: GNAT family protein [Flaviflexus sp.]|nr:GNAT family protein [Flaviflexus sp.]